MNNEQMSPETKEGLFNIPPVCWKVGKAVAGVILVPLLARTAYVHSGAAEAVHDTTIGRKINELVWYSYETQEDAFTTAGDLALDTAGLLITCNVDNAEDITLQPSTYDIHSHNYESEEAMRVAYLEEFSELMEHYGLTYISPQTEIEEINEATTAEAIITSAEGYFTKRGLTLEIDHADEADQFTLDELQRMFTNVIVAEAGLPNEATANRTVESRAINLDRDSFLRSNYNPFTNQITYVLGKLKEVRFTYAVSLAIHEWGHQIDFETCENVVKTYIDPTYRKLDDGHEASDYDFTIFESKAEAVTHLGQIIDRQDGLGLRARLLTERMNQEIPDLGYYMRDLSSWMHVNRLTSAMEQPTHTGH